MKIEEQLEMIGRGTVDIITKEELFKKLEEKRPLNVKFGIDPTAPDVHLGHTVPLQKLKQFQEMGHNVHLIIGDYTARIGDPSGKSETRPMLTPEKIEENLKSYTTQVFKILDRSKTELFFNSEWLEKFSGYDIIKLSSKHSVQQLLQRRDFKNRIEDNRPLSVAELIYPLLVGYDSVHLKTDIEIGGTDQLFNFKASRAIQVAYGQVPEIIITLPLLEGLDGIKKMSKSLNNAIGVEEEPSEIYGKIMSISDQLMLKYYELISDVSVSKLKMIKDAVNHGTENPMRYKQELAKEIVTRYHGSEATQKVQDEFDQIYRKKGMPEEIEKLVVTYSSDSDLEIMKILKKSGKVASNSQARRLLEQGGVKVDGSTVKELKFSFSPNNSTLLQIGKHFFRELCFIKEEN